MGKEEIVELLKDNKRKKYSCKELSQKCGIGKRSICTSLKKLRDTNEVNYEQVYEQHNHKDTYVYWFKA